MEGGEKYNNEINSSDEKFISAAAAAIDRSINNEKKKTLNPSLQVF